MASIVFQILALAALDYAGKLDVFLRHFIAFRYGTIIFYRVTHAYLRMKIGLCKA